MSLLDSEPLLGGIERDAPDLLDVIEVMIGAYNRIQPIVEHGCSMNCIAGTNLRIPLEEVTRDEHVVTGDREEVREQQDCIADQLKA
jgi:hypothetical protein